MRTGEPIEFAVGADRRRYVIDGQEIELPQGETIAYRPASGEPEDEDATLIFQSDGTSHGGVLTLSSSGDRQNRVEIDWLTGRVRRVD